MEKKQIVIAGNPVDGFSYYGPFDDVEEATNYAEDQFDEWWIADLEPIEESEESEESEER